MTSPTIRRPAKRPCGSCPYRRDAPSGLWDVFEYSKLPEFDAETPFQPPSVFMCHQRNRRLCAGWVAVHDMYESLGLRIASLSGEIGKEDLDATLEFETDVPLFASGAEAAKNGLAKIEDPPAEARRIMTKMKRRMA